MQLINTISEAEQKAVDSVNTKTELLLSTQKESLRELHTEFETKRKVTKDDLQKQFEMKEQKLQKKLSTQEKKLKDAVVSKKDISAYANALLRAL